MKETTQFGPHVSDSSTKNGKAASPATSQETFKAVNYTELIPILIKGMQEQNEQIESLNKQVQTQDSLKQEVQSLKQTVETLKAMLTKNVNASVSSATLDVPIPNPSKASTRIRYSIPMAIATAKLTIVNMSGQVLKEVSLTSGDGQVEMNVSNLASGIYPCSLWVNGQQVASRQLVIAH